MFPYPALPLINTFQKTCLPPMPFKRVYTNQHVSPEPVVIPVEISPSVIFTHSTPMPSLEDPKKQERKNFKFLMQSESLETQQKINLIKERLKAIKRNNVIRGMDATELSLVLDVIIPHKFKILTS